MNLTPEKLAQISAQLNVAKQKQDSMTSEQKRDAKAAKESAKAAKREAKAAVRLAKSVAKSSAKAAKDGAARQPNYLQKIEKLRSGLPDAPTYVLAITEQLSSTQFTDADLTVLSAHLGFEQRRRGILASADPPSKVAVGDTVEIMNCVNRKFIGLQGVVEKVRRIRAFIRVEGYTVPAYTFVSDLKVLSSGVQENQGMNILDLSEDEPEQVESSDEAQTGT